MERHRGRNQFSLRSILLVVTLLAIALAVAHRADKPPLWILVVSISTYLCSWWLQITCDGLNQSRDASDKLIGGLVGLCAVLLEFLAYLTFVVGMLLLVNDS